MYSSLLQSTPVYSSVSWLKDSEEARKLRIVLTQLMALQLQLRHPPSCAPNGAWANPIGAAWPITLDEDEELWLALIARQVVKVVRHRQRHLTRVPADVIMVIDVGRHTPWFTVDSVTEEIKHGYNPLVRDVKKWEIVLASDMKNHVDEKQGQPLRTDITTCGNYVRCLLKRGDLPADPYM
jgi:hypothetical protein